MKRDFETVMKWQPGRFVRSSEPFQLEPIERVSLSGEHMRREAPIGHPISSKKRSCEFDPPRHQHVVLIVSKSMSRYCEGFYDLHKQKWYSPIHALAVHLDIALVDAEWSGAQ